LSENHRSTTVEADAIVLAVPAFEAARLIRPLHAEAAEALAAIEYVPVALANLGYVAKVSGYGFLVGRSERAFKRGVLGAVFQSSAFAGRAPAGKSLVSVRIGGALHRDILELPDERLVEISRDELRRILDLAEPCLARVTRHPKALPQYALDHAARLEAVHAAEQSLPGLFFIGNAYRGLGVPDCVRDAQSVALRILCSETRRLCTDRRASGWS
jgi:oxygen-dependent protoporphyrinogen oxidase